MEIIRYPQRSEWRALTKRALSDTADEVKVVVANIIENIRTHGDDALKEYEKRFTGATLDTLAVGEEEFKEAEKLIDPELREAITVAEKNITAFHSAQRMTPVSVETSPGVKCMQRAVPIDKVGLYIPGGNSPLFSTMLMLAIPAGIAGCKEIIMCTPPGKDGKIHPAIIYAAQVAGVHRIYKTGGAQAIAAMDTAQKQYLPCTRYSDQETGMSWKPNNRSHGTMFQSTCRQGPRKFL